MLQGVHTRKINIPLAVTGAGDNIVVAAVPGKWIYIHELIGDLDVAGTIQIKSGVTVLATFDLAADQGLSLTDEPGEDNRPRFECPPGQDFIIGMTGGPTFTGNLHYSFGE